MIAIIATVATVTVTVTITAIITTIILPSYIPAPNRWWEVNGSRYVKKFIDLEEIFYVRRETGLTL